MCKSPGLGPSDYNQKRQKTIYDLSLHETMSIPVGYKFIHHETGCDEVTKYLTVMRVEGGWIYGADTKTPSFVPQISESKEKASSFLNAETYSHCDVHDVPHPRGSKCPKCEDEPEEKIVDGKLTVGTHKRVFEYDGLYHCLNCDAKWGAGWKVLEKAPLICDMNSVEKEQVPDRSGESKLPTTEYVGGKKTKGGTLGIMSNAVRRFFGGKD